MLVVILATDNVGTPDIWPDNVKMTAETVGRVSGVSAANFGLCVGCRHCRLTMCHSVTNVSQTLDSHHTKRFEHK